MFNDQMCTPLQNTLRTSVLPDYAGNAVYDGFSLAMLQIPGGYVTLSGTTPTYHYYQKDHLGSNRLVTRATGSVEQIVHYYPFGGQFGDGTAPALQQYKFTGKELDNALDAHLYDFGARSYDPALMRWSTPDPLIGKYPSLSPYTYCANSPANIVDLTGREFSERSKNYVSSVVLYANNQISLLSLAKHQLLSMIKNGDYTEKVHSLINKTIVLIDKNINAYIKAKEELTILSKSNQLYDIINDPSNNTEDASISVTSFNYKTGTVELRMGDDNVSSLAHELKHAYQFEIGQINFTIKPYSTLDKNDELEAYERTSLFGGKRFDSLPEDLYGNLPNHPIDFNYLGQTLIKNPQLLRAKTAQYRFDYAERVNGVTYYKNWK